MISLRLTSKLTFDPMISKSIADPRLQDSVIVATPNSPGSRSKMTWVESMSVMVISSRPRCRCSASTRDWPTHGFPYPRRTADVIASEAPRTLFSKQSTMHSRAIIPCLMPTIIHSRGHSLIKMQEKLQSALSIRPILLALSSHPFWVLQLVRSSSSTSLPNNMLTKRQRKKIRHKSSTRWPRLTPLAMETTSLISWRTLMLESRNGPPIREANANVWSNKFTAKSSRSQFLAIVPCQMQATRVTPARRLKPTWDKIWRRICDRRKWKVSDKGTSQCKLKKERLRAVFSEY